MSKNICLIISGENLFSPLIMIINLFPRYYRLLSKYE